MSQAGPIDVIGGNPEIPTEFITDDGTAVPIANQLEVLGKQTSDAVPVMWTIGSGNTVEIENRTWQTEYVVDPSSTAGDRGTFTTIQAAVDEAVANGDPAVIFIRQGTYVENITIDSVSVMLTAFSPLTMEPFQNNSRVFISGTVTVVSANPTFENVNISFVDQTVAGTNVYAFGCSFLRITSVGFVWLSNCIILSTGSTFTQTIRLRNCSFTVQGNCIECNGSGTQLITIQNCIGFTPTASPGSSIVINNAAIANIVGCTNLVISGNTTGAVTVQNTTLRNTINLPNAVIRVSNISYSSQGTGTELSTQVPSQLAPTSSGNIASRRIVTATGDVTENDQYVGCRQAGAITLTLSASVNFYKGQEIRIADESGDASTNNITISGSINGGSSVTINTDYGSYLLIFDGTNWFTSTWENTSQSITTTYNLVDSGATWTKDSRTQRIDLFVWGAGAGGGSGRKGTSGNAGGGAGGCAGETLFYSGPESWFPDSALVTIGTGGTGGASQTTNATTGNPGTSGGASSFGSIATNLSTAGGGGSVGTIGNANGRGVRTNFSITAIGGTGNGGSGINVAGGVGGSSNTICPAGGGGGGGANNATERAGGVGGAYISDVSTIILAGGTAGLESTGINGGNGNPPTGLFPTGSATGLLAAGTGGGGGGGYSVGAGGATTGGTGGNGAVPGGGGGGGGGGIDAVANSGAGGNGADGRIVVIEYF